MKTSSKHDLKRFQHRTPQTGKSSRPTVALTLATSTGTSPEPSDPKTDCTPAVSFELMLEAIRQRHETKTAILQEALQRSECSQQRFWGINE
jgi:hypothetical protein